MRTFFKMRTLTGWLLCLLCVSCAVDQHFEFPVGPQGPKGDPGTSGLSAYEVWLDFIQDNPDYMGGYTEADFFLYLKGDPGEGLGDIGDQLPSIGENNNWWIGGEDTGVPVNGTDGADGTPGLTAYQVWVQMISGGNADDPHNPDPEVKWPAERNSEEDFYDYLSLGEKGNPGDPGKTAYQLWYDDLHDGNGLDHPTKPGKWPVTADRMEDFYDYLSGAPGKNAPGGTIEVLIGKYNVIPQYTQQEYSEFVRTQDGSVIFTVFDKETGLPTKGLKVSAMPGVSQSVFDAQGGYLESGENGRLELKKEWLPVDVPEETRRGLSIVEGEPSADNTYVPEKVDIRMRLRGPIILSGGNTSVPVIVERRTEADGDWEIIPGYLQGNSLSQPVRHYYVSKEDATIPVGATSSPVNINISSSAPTLTQGRPKVNSPYLDDVYESNNGGWSGTVEYFAPRLESYYGEMAQLQYSATDERHVIIQRVPIQRLPIITAVTTENPRVDGDYTLARPTRGEIDMSSVLYEYFYNTTLVQEDVEDVTTHVVFYPTEMDTATVDAKQLFRVGFTKKLNEGEGTSILETEPITIDSPLPWVIGGPIFDGSDVYVQSMDANMFYGVPYNPTTGGTSGTGTLTNRFYMGQISFASEIIEGKHDTMYNVDDIPVTVTITPEP